MSASSGNDRVRRIIIAGWLRSLLTSEDMITAALPRVALDRSDIGDMRFVHALLSNSKAMAPNRTDVPSWGPPAIS